MVSNAVKKMREAGKAYLAKKNKTPTSSSSASARQKQQSEAIERWKRGEITKEQAVKLTKKISRGGGTGAAADPKKYQLALKAERKHAAKIAEAKRQAEQKLAQEKAIAEAKTFAEKQRLTRTIVQQRQVQTEQKRIAQLRQKLIQQNAQKTVRDYIDKNTKQKVRHENLINRRTGERIFTITNLVTGEIQTRTYEKPERGGRVRQTGGLTIGEQKNTLADIKQIQSQLPTGEKLIYNPKTFKIIGINSKQLNMTIPYTNKGIDYYNAQMSKVVPKFDFKEYAKEVKAQADLTKQTMIPSKLSRNINIVKNVLLDKINPAYRILFTKIKPTALDNQNLIKLLYSNKFNKKLETLGKKFFIGVNRVTNNINYKIDELKKEKNTTKKNEIKKEILTLKEKLIVKFAKVHLIPYNYTKRQATMFALGMSARIFMFVGAVPGMISAIPGLVTAGVKGTPIFLKKLITDPKAVAKSGYTISKKLATVIKTQVAIFAKLLIVEPGLAIGYITGEYFVLRGIGKGFTIVGKVTKPIGQEIMKLSPKAFKIVDGKIILRNAPSEVFTVKGTTRLLEKRVLQPSIFRPFTSVADFIKGRKPGQFKKFTKDPGLVLKVQTATSSAKPLSAQAKLAGKEVTAVNAAADQLTTWLRRKKIIRKPIPGEEKFPTQIKNILNKFDSGKRLTTKEFADVNLWLQKNVAKNITLLERSLYLDPAFGLRIKRLGIQATRTATFRDILKGNFRLWNKAGKPQVLIFENAKIAKFPKSLNSIKRKLLADTPLTVAETNQLIRWQVKTGSGKFKPIGSTIYNLGKELEITLAPGEMIKRIKRVGFTYIDGKKVTFVTAEIFKPTKQLLAQMKKANLGKLSNTQVSSLEKTLSKKLGRKVRVETPSTRKITIRDLRRADTNIPVLRVRGRGIFVVRILRGVRRITRPTVKRINRRRISKRVTKARPIKRVLKRPPKRPPVRPPRRPPKRPPVRPPRRPPKRPPVRPPRRPPKRPPLKPPIIPIIPKGFTRRKLSKKQSVFYVVEKVRGRFRKLYPKKLTKGHAADYAVHSIDNKLSKTAFLIPMGYAKLISQPPKSIQGYYNRNSHKVRKYKIKYGKRHQMVSGFIEKRKYAFDRPMERSQSLKLRLLARRKVKSKTPFRRVVKKRTLVRKPQSKKIVRIVVRRRKPVRRKKKR